MAVTPLKLLPLLIVSSYAYAQTADTNIPTLESVVAVALSKQVNRVILAPKNPVQPIPAADGAGLLKTIPNMNLTRKGGVASDPLFRGLGGSRLAITADDAYLFGGCGGRMDPPTTYIFPDSYDEVIVTKGPQTVTQGPGLVSGSVAFKRQAKYFPEPDVQFDAAVTAASNSRYDAFANFAAGFDKAYIRADLSRNISHDYKDGAGDKVHSAYQRHAQNIALGITPTENTLIEFAYSRSRGWAEYADRKMDGAFFDRDAYNIHAEARDLNTWLSKLSLDYGYSAVDHGMDTFSHRTVPSMMIGMKMSGMKMSGMKMAPYSTSNPDRRTQTLRFASELNLGPTRTQLGIDWMDDKHRFRSSSGYTLQEGYAYKSQPRLDNQSFSNVGIFAETEWILDEQNKIITGYRHDATKAKYYQANNNYQAALEAGQVSRTYHLNAGFLRYEYENEGMTYFAGYGFAQRSPDFWERNKGNGWNLNKETNHEVDLGLIYQGEQLSGSLTVFASQVKDFILIDKQAARNITARRYGFEGDIEYQFAPHWKVGTSVALTFAQNRTDKRPLAQTPPLEANTYIGYDDGTYSANLLMRNVAAQHRIAANQGNIIGQDSTPSSGFSVFSFNAGWQAHKNLKITAGVDNIFNKKYSEHINKTAADIAGYNPVIGKVYEPGRQYWLRLQASY